MGKLKRKWYEYIWREHYNIRQEKHEAFLLKEMQVEKLKRAFQNLKNAYPGRIEIEMPVIDLNDEENFLKKVKCFKEEMRRQYSLCEREIEEEKRNEKRGSFIKKAIGNARGRLVVITTEYKPAPALEARFILCAARIKRNPEEISSISCCGLWTEWLAFCPDYIDNSDKIIENWGGNPETATVTYI